MLTESRRRLQRLGIEQPAGSPVVHIVLRIWWPQSKHVPSAYGVVVDKRCKIRASPLSYGIPINPPPKPRTVVSVARSDTCAGPARMPGCAPLLPRPRRGLRSQMVAHDGRMVPRAGEAVKREIRSRDDAAQGAPRSRGWQRRWVSQSLPCPSVLQLCGDPAEAHILERCAGQACPLSTRPAWATASLAPRLILLS